MIRAVSKASLDTPEALRRFSSNALFPFIAQLFHVLVSVDALPDLSAQAIKFQKCYAAVQRRCRSSIFYYPLRFEYLFNSVSSPAAALGGWIEPWTISALDSCLPYRSLFASSSGRSVAPSNEIPANNPRAREYVRSWPRISTSVAPEA